MATRRFDVRFADTGAVTIPSRRVAALAEKLTLLQAAAGLRAFSVALLPEQQHPPDTYRYRFEAVGGRVWQQLLHVPVTGDPTMTFSVTDYWSLSEFASHRDVRDAVVALIQSERLVAVTV